MKAFTDLEQSKKLAEILPLESADMCYPLPCEDKDKPLLEQGGFGSMPCWSLAALLNVIPNYKLSSEHNYHTCTAGTPFGNGTVAWFDNPVDVCVEMILKLHELKVL